jgi:hypothetical protein
MMAHRTKPKISSDAAMLLRRAQLRNASFNELVDKFEEVQSFLTYPIRKNVLVDLANAQGEKGVEWFWRKWKDGFRPETTKDLVELGNDLRDIWLFMSADVSSNQDNPFRVLNKWLAWRPTVEQLEAWRVWGERFREGALLLGIDMKAYEYVPFLCSPKFDKLLPDPNCLRAMLVQGVFEHLRHFSYCANSDCAAPYFIAKRTDQTVCDAGICKAERQREHARKWWKQNRTKQISATPAKGKLKNGTHKTR